MHDDIIKIVKELATYPNEEEWFEFKENWYNNGCTKIVGSTIFGAVAPEVHAKSALTHLAMVTYEQQCKVLLPKLF